MNVSLFQFVFLSTIISRVYLRAVEVILQTHWNHYSLLAQAGEFFADVDPILFWKFSNFTAKYCKMDSTDEEDFDCAFNFCSLHLSFGYCELLSFSLGLNYYAPRIQMYRQIAEGVLRQNCEIPHSYNSCNAFVVICNTHVICKSSQIDAYLPVSFLACNASILLPFDHKSSSHINYSNSFSVIVYGPFGNGLTLDFFETIDTLTQMGSLDGFIYRPWYKATGKEFPLLLSGYGVELAIKSTEYRAIDDAFIPYSRNSVDIHRESETELDGLKFEVLSSVYSKHSIELLLFKRHLIDLQKDFVPLKQWQLTDLGFQLCQWLLNTFPDKGINALYGLSRFVQNLPVESKHLYSLEVTDGLRREIVFNQRIFSKFGIESGKSIVIFNGKIFTEYDPFSLISFIRGELFFFANIKSLGIVPEDILNILFLTSHLEEMDYGIDLRHKSILFVNDIETDFEYLTWTSNIQDLLRPTFPGVIRQVRRNFFNLLMCFDPFDPLSYSLLKSANFFLSQAIPIRIALLLIPNNPLDILHTEKVNDISCLFNELMINTSSRIAFHWLLEICTQLYYKNGTLSLTQVQNIFYSFSGLSPNSFIIDCSEYNSFVEDFIFSRGLSHFPTLFLNGIPLELTFNYTNSELFIDGTVSIIKDAIFFHTRIFQHDIYFGNLRNQMNIYNYIMTRSNIVKRLNYRILTRNPAVIHFFCFSDVFKSWFENLSSLPSCEIHQAFARDTPYIYTTHNHYDNITKPHSLWLIADFSSNIGFTFLMDCLRMLSTSNRTRLGLIFNYDPTINFNLNHFIHTLIFSQPEHLLFNFILQLQYIFQYSNLTLDEFITYFSTIEGFNEVMFRDFYSSDEFYITGLNYFHFSSNILNIPRGMRGIISNGQILGRLVDSEYFNSDDFLFLSEFSSKNVENTLLKLVDKYEIIYPTLTKHTLFNNASSPNRIRSDMLLYLSTIIFREENFERTIFPFDELLVKYSVIRIKPRVSNAYYFSLNIVMDPISREAQKLLPLSLELYDTFNIDLHIWLSPLERLSEIPINRFYKYLISGRPFFEKNGSISRNLPNIKFLDLPRSPLLNLLMDTPHVWIIEPIKSEHDLDNLDMKSDSNFIQAIFKLSNILLEGHCWLHSSNEPVPGIQFSLGTLSEPKKFDSLVMANLGYFQFKISPGLWKLELMDGKSYDKYYIADQKGNNILLLGDVILIISDNFLGNHLQIFLSKKMNNQISKLTTTEDDMEESNEYKSTLNSIWSSVSNLLPSVKKSSNSNFIKTSDNVINIFSIASGHLYERFLRIMILSVLKHSKSSIKFWILKQYLSPSFMENFPMMALKYNFTFEFVNYKWPKWLRKQNDKQREIWGYKILFLDVLFPMDLKRIIYVDADQIVRSDLLELVHIDLKKSPYGYTPFCDSKTEMDGYRFWKHGYWQNLLGDRKYHISALYVVDLFRFRELSAGDKLRGNYQALSQDPNSLANLDQDLPNSMIHSVPIFSLPQEWLWCETWCSDKDKINAKTIDICNNPLTKEPKLVAAKRIVSEWNEYDNEIKNFLKGITDNDSIINKDNGEPFIHSEL